MKLSPVFLLYLQLNTLDLNLYHTQEFSGGFIETVVAEFYSQNFWICRWGPQVCISNKFPDDDAIGSGKNAWFK